MHRLSLTFIFACFNNHRWAKKVRLLIAAPSSNHSYVRTNEIAISWWIRTSLHKKHGQYMLEYVPGGISSFHLLQHWSSRFCLTQTTHYWTLSGKWNEPDKSLCKFTITTSISPMLLWEKARYVEEVAPHKWSWHQCAYYFVTHWIAQQTLQHCVLSVCTV